MVLLIKYNNSFLIRNKITTIGLGPNIYLSVYIEIDNNTSN